MKPKILKSESDYEDALKVVDSLMDAEPGSADEDDLELWSMLVEQYESVHYPVDPPDPIEAIKFRMEQLDLDQKDLREFIPTKSKISEVLNRKRPLSLSMIRALNTHLGISAEVLVREPEGIYRVKDKRASLGKKPAKKQKVRA